MFVSVFVSEELDTMTNLERPEFLCPIRTLTIAFALNSSQ